MTFNEIFLLLEHLYFKCGYIIIFLSSFVETTPLGFAIPGGTIVVLGGYFAFNTQLSIIGVILSGTLGMLCTFYISYFLGKKTGLTLSKKLHQEKNVSRAKKILEKHGPIILTTSLLANLTRFWMAYVAGTEKYSFWKFSIYSFIAALSWNSFLATIGYIAGNEKTKIETNISQISIISWLLLLISASIIYIKIKKEIQKDVNFK